MSSAFIKSILAEIPTATSNASFNRKLYRMWKIAEEEEGVKLLLEHNALQLLSNRIATCTDRGLNETLISTIARMCIFEEASAALLHDNKTAMLILLSLIHTQEHCLLIQLMYLLKSLLNHVNPGQAAAKKWLKYFDEKPDFMTQYCTILSRTSSNQQQICTLEVLCIILDGIAPKNRQYKSNLLAVFYRVFINKELVISSCKAFERFLSDMTTLEFGYFPDTQQVMSTFLNIHCILSSYKSKSIDCYCQCMDTFMCCLGKILTALNHFVTVLPVNDLDVKMAEFAYLISKQLRYPFDEVCFIQMFEMWARVKSREDTQAQLKELNINFHDIVLENLKGIVNFVSINQLKKALASIDSRTLERYLSTLEILANAPNSENDIITFYSRIKLASDTLLSA